MFGLPRFAPRKLHTLALAAALAMPVMGLAPFARAQEAAPAAPTAPAINPELKGAVENYWHYGKVARYDLAAAEAKKIVESGADPEMVLRAFEQVSTARNDNLDQWLLRWQGVEQMRETTVPVIKLVAEGYRARRSSPDFIRGQIERLNLGERPYGLAMSRLLESGELAVPFMLETLRDPGKKSLQPTIRRALRDLGQRGLNPLVAATEMQEWDTLTVVVGVLGDTGYPAVAPYIARLLESQQAPPAVKQAASEALAKLGVAPSASTKASDLYYDVGVSFYNGTCSIVADTRYPNANIWYWSQQGLERKEVPHEIYHELMAMRASEYTLKLGGAKSDDALSLWLAANFKREAELPEGAADATRPEGYPPGHYWGVSAGAKYLEAALARALGDRNAAVAFRSIRSLQEIVGQGNLASGQSQPLINAMQFADRKVRFEAAFALAAALPQQNFEGSTRVVPLLAEALAQTGQPSVLVVAPNQDQVNKLVDGLKGAGYAAAGATTAEGAASVAISLPACDVIVVSEDLGAGNVDQLFIMAGENARLAGAARLVMTKTEASIYEPRKVSETLLSTTTATEPEALKPAIEAARVKAGSLPLDDTVATDYATRAGNLMLKVGINRNPVLPLDPAKQSLLAALSDARPDIVKLSGNVLGLLNDKDAQGGLLMTASDEKTADDVKISLYKSLATNAKNYGNHLSPEQVQTLEKTVADATNLEVRAAAAEARGALNLPADQAKTLVVGQSKV